ncbi:MAG: hypothetical protein LC776_02775, partial [Acidobacteria bacterium]|nr:hypothetical protein [Acidobacteriota bacterium]
MLAIIPSAVDPPSGERTGTWGATVKPDVTRAAQPGAPGAGLLGFARVDGRQDDSPQFDHPEPERFRRRHGVVMSRGLEPGRNFNRSWDA